MKYDKIIILSMLQDALHVLEIKRFNVYDRLISPKCFMSFINETWIWASMGLIKSSLSFMNVNLQITRNHCWPQWSNIDWNGHPRGPGVRAINFVVQFVAHFIVEWSDLHLKSSKITTIQMSLNVDI